MLCTYNTHIGTHARIAREYLRYVLPRTPNVDCPAQEHTPAPRCTSHEVSVVYPLVCICYVSDRSLRTSPCLLGVSCSCTRKMRTHISSHRYLASFLYAGIVFSLSDDSGCSRVPLQDIHSLLPSWSGLWVFVGPRCAHLSYRTVLYRLLFLYRSSQCIMLPCSALLLVWNSRERSLRYGKLDLRRRSTHNCTLSLVEGCV